MLTKDWKQSRTVIANAISLIIALATLFAGPELGLPPEVAHWAGITLAVANVVNIWLRTVTAQPLSGTAAARRYKTAILPEQDRE